MKVYRYPTGHYARSVDHAGCTSVSVRHYWLSGGMGGYTSWKHHSTNAKSTTTVYIQGSQHYGNY